MIEFTERAYGSRNPTPKDLKYAKSIQKDWEEHNPVETMQVKLELGQKKEDEAVNVNEIKLKRAAKWCRMLQRGSPDTFVNRLVIKIEERENYPSTIEQFSCCITQGYSDLSEYVHNFIYKDYDGELQGAPCRKKVLNRSRLSTHKYVQFENQSMNVSK